MNTKEITMVLVAISLLMISSGCATNGARSNYDSSIRKAQAQISDGQNNEAIENLKSARQIAKENKYDQSTCRMGNLHILPYLDRDYIYFIFR